MVPHHWFACEAHVFGVHQNDASLLFTGRSQVRVPSRKVVVCISLVYIASQALCRSAMIALAVGRAMCRGAQELTAGE